MARIIKFPDKSKERSRAEAQRRWLAENHIPVVVPWKFPEDTWFRKRLEKVRSRRLLNCKV